MSAEREMTLEEWVARLPEFHLAHRQYTEMRENTDKLAAEIVRLRGEVAALLEDPDEAELAYRCGDPDSDAIAPAEAKGDGRLERRLLFALGDALAEKAQAFDILAAKSERYAAFRAAENRDAAGGYNPAAEAIQFALTAEEGLAFLRAWNEGDFTACRMEWPEAPDTVYIGADPLIQTPAPLQAAPQEGEGPWLGEALRFLGELESVGNLRAGEVARGLRRHAAHHSACELGAVRELPAKWRERAEQKISASQHASIEQKCIARFRADDDLDRANELEAALQHRGDSRGGEG